LIELKIVIEVVRVAEVENIIFITLTTYYNPYNIYNMIEIFKTNVKNKRLASRVLKTLHANLPGYLFNFDLEDCDRILRAQSRGITIETSRIIGIAKDCRIEICVFED
jgi:hypothetical protein